MEWSGEHLYSIAATVLFFALTVMGAIRLDELLGMPMPDGRDGEERKGTIAGLAVCVVINGAMAVLGIVAVVV